MKQDVVDLIMSIKVIKNPLGTFVFMEILRAHYSAVVKQAISDHGWEILYNAPYSSDYHCIEVKRAYKKGLIEADIKKNNMEQKTLIQRSIGGVQTTSIKQLILRQFMEMKSYL